MLPNEYFFHLTKHKSKTHKFTGFRMKIPRISLSSLLLIIFLRFFFFFFFNKVKAKINFWLPGSTCHFIISPGISKFPVYIIMQNTGNGVSTSRIKKKMGNGKIIMIILPTLCGTYDEWLTLTSMSLPSYVNKISKFISFVFFCAAAAAFLVSLFYISQ